MDKVLNRILEELKELNGRMGNMENKVGRLDDRLGGLETRVGGLDDRIGGLEARVGGLEARVEAIFEEVAGAREWRHKFQCTLEDIWEDQASIFQTLGEHQNSINTLRRRTAQTK